MVVVKKKGSDWEVVIGVEKKNLGLGEKEKPTLPLVLQNAFMQLRIETREQAKAHADVDAQIKDLQEQKDKKKELPK